MSHATAPAAPTLLFGAFDRHNFGDLLFPHVATALLPGRELRFVGLAARDLRGWGGHRVEALATVAAQLGATPANLLHVGGELLACDAWEAAVMLLPAQQVPAILARLDQLPAERLAWARQALGIAGRAPYVVGTELLPQARRLFAAVGGMDLDARAPELRAEVREKLRTADFLAVRDARTLAWLRQSGIAAALLPDPAVLVAELFAARIARHAGRGEIARLRRDLARGYLAVQFSTEFADDASLAAIAAGLQHAAHAHGLGVALFRAGAAPWHDELDGYRRCAARLAVPVRIVESLDIWDICALLAHSRGYLGSSLHGRIVAGAFARPRLNLHAAAPGKPAAYAATWETGLPLSVAPADIAAGLDAALAADPASLRRLARELAARYREGFAALHARLL